MAIGVRQGNGYARITLVQVGTIWEAPYAGEVGGFTAPYPGIYKIEAYGGQGGYAVGGWPSNGNTTQITEYGGKGGYAQGNTVLTNSQTIYYAVGGQGGFGDVEGKDTSGGWNGGGKGTGDGHPEEDAPEGSGGGGGATHFATTNRGELSGYASNQGEVLIVAGGGRRCFS